MSLRGILAYVLVCPTFCVQDRGLQPLSGKVARSFTAPLLLWMLLLVYPLFRGVSWPLPPEALLVKKKEALCVSALLVASVVRQYAANLYRRV